MTNSISLNYIGQVTSPYKEKFAIPRQPGLVTAAKGYISLLGDLNNPESVRGLAEYSHIWVMFIFHASQQHGWKPLVKPPRLGGNKKLGVLSTRSPFRPNPIGMSVVKLEQVEITNSNNVLLHISGMDLLDKTPVIDIKPYIPYSDSLEHAKAGFAQQSPETNIQVTFSEKIKPQFNKWLIQYPSLQTLIVQVLQQDPRPAYKKEGEDDKIYGMTLYKFNIQWHFVSMSHIKVIEITMKG